MTEVLNLDMAGWDRVSLAELNARAPLLDRLENKYVVSAAAFTDGMSGLREHFEVLAIDGETTFTYETVYYDTDTLLAYRHPRESVGGSRSDAAATSRATSTSWR